MGSSGSVKEPSFLQEEERGGFFEVKMKNKVELILLISLFSIGLGLERINAQEQPESVTSRPSLNGLEATDYKRVKIGIEQLNGAAKIIGLTEDRIRTRCELRLRQYGLEPVPVSDKISEFVYIGIHVVGMAYHTWVDFGRPVVFSAENALYKTSGKTWFRSETGTHGGDAEFILRGLDSLFDEFLKEYLKANSK
jgi:hypothetical protein